MSGIAAMPATVISGATPHQTPAATREVAASVELAKGFVITQSMIDNLQSTIGPHIQFPTVDKLKLALTPVLSDNIRKRWPNARLYLDEANGIMVLKGTRIPTRDDAETVARAMMQGLYQRLKLEASREVHIESVSVEPPKTKMQGGEVVYLLHHTKPTQAASAGNLRLTVVGMQTERTKPNDRILRLVAVGYVKTHGWGTT
jgi:hypothetical protein